MRFFVFLPAAVLALFIANASYAQNNELIYREEHFQALDANNDGKISAEEYRQFMDDAFTQLDTNGVGYLDRNETEGVFNEDHFEFLVGDKTGKISRHQFLDQAMRDFHFADQDGDGYLDYP